METKPVPPVVKLVPKTQEHRDGVVKTLKNMLEIAERGELLGIATLIGANERLKHRLLEYRDGDV